MVPNRATHIYPDLILFPHYLGPTALSFRNAFNLLNFNSIKLVKRVLIYQINPNVPRISEPKGLFLLGY